MMLTVKAEIDEKGNVTILEPLSFSGSRRALVVILDEPAPLSAEWDGENLTEAALEAEDRVWDEALKRNANQFAELRAQAEIEIAEGRTTDTFDENGEFTLK